MRLDAEVGEQARVDGRVERLDATVETLWKSGQLLHARDRVAQRLHQRRSVAGGDDLDSRCGATMDKLRQAGLVVHADECAPDRPTILCGHGTVTFLPVMVQPSRTIRPTYSTSWRRSAALMRSVRVSTVSSSSTSTATCAMMGPVSTPLSTKNSVAPVTLTPYSRASRGPCMPGKLGSSELCVLM